MIVVLLGVGRSLQGFYFRGIRFHAFGHKDCTVEADYSLSNATFAAVED